MAYNMIECELAHKSRGCLCDKSMNYIELVCVCLSKKTIKM